jgi:hypothetical protein
MVFGIVPDCPGMPFGFIRDPAFGFAGIPLFRLCDVLEVLRQEARENCRR